MKKSWQELEELKEQLWEEDRLIINRDQVFEFESAVMENMSAQYRYLSAIKDAALFKLDLDESPELRIAKQIDFKTKEIY